MADTFGAVELPVDPTTLPVGDPALAKLGAFLQAVLNDKLGAAWAALRPRPDGDERPVVAVFTHDPRRRSFIDTQLPALFVYRPKGEFQRAAYEFEEDHSDIRVLWIFPPDMQEKATPRAPFANAVVKACRAALEVERHPDWVDDGDTDARAPSYAVDTDSILLAKTAGLTAASYNAASLDGVIGDDTMAPRREVRVTTTAATGAYSGNVTLTGLDVFGLSKTWTVALAANGGQSTGTGDDATRITNVAWAGQPLASGSISVGTSAVVGRGSNVLGRCGFSKCQVRRWESPTVQVEILHANDSNAQRQVYDAVELHLDVIEQSKFDLTDATRFPTNDGADLAVLQGAPFTAPSMTVERDLEP